MSLDKQINVTEFGKVDIDKVKTDLEHFDRLIEKPIHRARFGYEEVIEVLYMCDPIDEYAAMMQTDLRPWPHAMFVAMRAWHTSGERCHDLQAH